MKCSVRDCDNDATITTPLPLCDDDALAVAAATETALEVEAKMSRVQALTEVTANPLATDAELADRTGWPVEWVRRHRGR